MNGKNAKTTAEAEIRNLIEKWAMAVRNENLDGILANHSPDTLLFDVPPPPQSKGIEAYKKSWDVFFPWFQGSGIFEVNELNITAGADVAFATALIRCAGTESNGDKTKLEVRLTVGYRKIADQWTVMHEHHSVPCS